MIVQKVHLCLSRLFQDPIHISLSRCGNRAHTADCTLGTALDCRTKAQDGDKPDGEVEADSLRTLDVTLSRYKLQRTGITCTM